MNQNDRKFTKHENMNRIGKDGGSSRSSSVEKLDIYF